MEASRSWELKHQEVGLKSKRKSFQNCAKLVLSMCFIELEDNFIKNLQHVEFDLILKIINIFPILDRRIQRKN